MKTGTTLLKAIAAAALAAGFCASASALDIRSVRTLDSLRSQRTTFSSTENITFTCEVNSTEAAGKVSFTFIVYDPRGAQVFKHAGNSIPGTLGVGGSEVGNIPVSSFYSTFGTFTLEVTATPDSGAAASQRTAFAVHSPIITLSYPPNGVLDVVDQPLIFRWVASGASRYRVYVDDDQSFYNALFTDYTQDTVYVYPLNPSDSRQRLSSGTQYYWKVEGLDAQGNKIAQSPTPFMFSLKQSGSLSSTRDVAITAAGIGQETAPPQINITIEVKNMGGSAENNVTVTLYIGGMVYGSQKIDLINAGEVKLLSFDVTMPELAPDQPLFVSASHNLYDDNIRNNIYTQSLALKDSYFTTKFARVAGRVTDASTGDFIADAAVSYKGPKSGQVTTKQNGQYRIEGLTEGVYTITAVRKGYSAEEQTITIEKARAYPNVNFDMLGEADGAAYTVADIWELIKPGLSTDIRDRFEGYAVYEIKGAGEREINEIADQLKSKKAKIISAETD